MDGFAHRVEGLGEGGEPHLAPRPPPLAARSLGGRRSWARRWLRDAHRSPSSHRNVAPRGSGSVGRLGRHRGDRSARAPSRHRLSRPLSRGLGQLAGRRALQRRRRQRARRRKEAAVARALRLVRAPRPREASRGQRRPSRRGARRCLHDRDQDHPLQRGRLAPGLRPRALGRSPPAPTGHAGPVPRPPPRPSL